MHKPAQSTQIDGAGTRHREADSFQEARLAGFALTGIGI